MNPSVSSGVKLRCQMVCLIAWFATGITTTAENWPNYRGPDHNGISRETNWQADWIDTPPNVLWRTEIGTGSSSIVTSVGHVFTLGNQGNEDEGETDSVYCLDAATG